MLDIKDVEEKRLIVAYFICRNKKGFGLDVIWRAWTQWWKNDFATKDGILKMYDHRFILSQRKLKAGVPVPEYCKKYDEFNEESLTFVKEKYDTKISKKENTDRLKIMLLSHKEECAKNLYKVFKDSHLKQGGYRLQNQTSKRQPLLLGHYSIFCKEKDDGSKYVMSGSYETVLKYINDKLQEENSSNE